MTSEKVDLASEQPRRRTTFVRQSVMPAPRKLRKVSEIGALRVERLDLVASTSWLPELPENAGFEEARSLLAEASERRPEAVELQNTSDWTEERCLKLYAEKIRATGTPAHPTGMNWDYRFSGVLGTRSRPGCYVARDVSVLAAQFVELPVPLVAPHADWRRVARERGSDDRRTILDTLKLLAEDEQRRLFGRLV